MKKTSEFNDYKTILLIGWIFVIAGLLANEWIVKVLFNPAGALVTFERVLIRSFDLFMIFLGALLILFHKRLKPANLAVLGVSFVFCLVGAELFLRIVEKKESWQVFAENPGGEGSYRLRSNLEYNFKFNLFGEERNYSIKTNSFGMRWRPVTLEKPAGVRRIAFVGDSFTFGESASTVEQSFVGVFDSLLHGQSYETMNFGVDGYGLGDEEMHIRENVLSFKPDYIVLMFFNGNDIRDSYLGVHKFDISSGVAVWNQNVIANKIPEKYRGGRFSSEGIGQPEKPAGKPAFEDRLKTLRLLQRLQSAVKFFEQKEINAPKIEHVDLSRFQVEPYFTSFSFWSQKNYSEVMDEAVDASLQRLENISAVCRDNNIQLLIAAIPFEEQVYAQQETGVDSNGVDYDISLPQKFVKKFAEDRDIPFLDLLPPLREHRKNSDTVLYPDWDKKGGDIHFNNQGHRLVAFLLKEFFEANNSKSPTLVVSNESKR